VLVDESAEGNVFSMLRTREADLEKHLAGGKAAAETPMDVALEKAREEARKKAEDEARKGINPPRAPEYGSDKDFQLAQAINQLKGRPVMISKTQIIESKLEKKDTN
jgi:carboxyl-terminal processing protease